MDDEFSNAVLINPPEKIHLLLSSGNSIPFFIYFDQGTNKSLVRCDLCRKFLVLGVQRSTVKLANHREKKECKKRAERLMRAQVVEEETLKAERALAQQFPDGSREIIGPSTPPQSELAPTDGEITPTLTPRPSFANFRFSDQFGRTAHAFGLAQTGSAPFSSSAAPTADLPFTNGRPCEGQWVDWYPGSIWDTYAYQQHEHKEIPWTLVGIQEGRVRLQSKTCEKYLAAESDPETGKATCQSCRALLVSPKLTRFMERASADALPRTPWKYLNFHQTKALLLGLTKKVKRYELQARHQKRVIRQLSKKIDDYKRLVMLLSQKKIVGVATMLAVSLRKGESPQAIQKRLEQAINSAFAPRSGWTDREYDIAFLAKALSGSRLLYVLQKAEGYPSNTTLKRRRQTPEIIVSAGKPAAPEIDANISAFMGKTGRQPPSEEDLLIGLILMIDGVALEEACRYDHKRGIILGICREHVGDVDAPPLEVDSIDNIDNIAQALYESKLCHHGKDGTVVAIAPLTGTENYFPVPIALSGSCKTEKAPQLTEWVLDILTRWHLSPDGERRHGKIERIATDGEASFRCMRFDIGLRIPLDRHSPLGQILYNIPGLNCFTGPNGLITTCDPKHIIKRFATMIRSPSGIQIGDTLIKSEDFFMALTIFQTVTEDKARLLLNPADKQNVPQAVNLLQTLLDVHNINTIANPTHLHRIKAAVFFATILSKFLFPFIKVEMSLSEQIQSLSTFAHLITAFHLQHRSGFMNNALFGDAQAIVKSIIFNTARLQTIRPSIKYHILLEGTDRLEGVFSHARTQDHSRNFDILQLSHKLSVGAEINAIFERNPDLDRGHARRNLIGARGVDHVNPKSWIGEVEVGSVNIHARYLAGRQQADKLLNDHLGSKKGVVNWDTLFLDRTCDHLRPEAHYVGSRAADQDPYDDDSGELVDGLLQLASAAQGLDKDPTNFSDARDELYECEDTLDAEHETTDPDTSSSQQTDKQVEELEFEPQILNPYEATRRTRPYLMVGTRERHIDALVAERLVSDRARKSTIRTLRAQGVTIAETISPRRGQKIENSENKVDNVNMVKCGDLGAFLTRAAGKVSIAVGEILNFRQGTSRNNLNEIDIDDLDSETGAKITTVAVQVLDLSPIQTDGPTTEFTWQWTKKYVQTLTSKDGITNQRHFMARIPGKNFYPLGPDVMVDAEDTPVWTLEHSDLTAALDEAWKSLNPDEDEIVTNIESLPEVFGEGLPYKSNAGIPQLYIANPPIPLMKLQAKDQLSCRICKKVITLNKMRNHVGEHILRSLRTREFEIMDVFIDQADIESISKEPVIGWNPCGWCGVEGCKTQMVKKAKTISISSNCPYHYSKMVYSRAMISSESSPCTNIPVSCPICPLGRGQQAPTFWKYNLIHHMTQHHLDDDGQLPPFPPELRVSTHITRLEEERMGVELADTIHYRTTYRVPDSDGLQDPMDVEEDDRWDPTSGNRKRAASVFSQASTTASRQPSSPKAKRMA